MELHFINRVRQEFTCYMDGDLEIWHGEYKDWHDVGRVRKWEHSFYYHGERHGEYKLWGFGGELARHIFFVHGESRDFVEMTKQEKLLFQIQHPGFRFIEE